MTSAACDAIKSIHDGPLCTGWGDPPSPVHGCSLDPDHRGIHRCRCGESWRGRRYNT